MTTTQAIDPRTYYRDALGWATKLIAGVAPEQLTQPTPCTEYDVRALVGHLVTTVRRARAIGVGESPLTVPMVSTGVPDERWAAEYDDAAAAALAAWADDAALDRDVTVPWGTVPGRMALWAYTNETLVHGWDLAVATGQHPEAAPELVETVLLFASQVLPGQPRGGPVPFAAAVRPAADAGPTQRLANWSGRPSGVLPPTTPATA